MGVGGYSGEKSARWSIDADGVTQFGDGGDAADFDTRIDRPRAVVSSWDPEPLAQQGGGASFNVSVPNALVGDLVQVTHEGLGGAMVLLSAHVSSPGFVTVVAMNAGATSVDLPNATVRLLLTRV